jgi:hypothetical protein
MRGFLLWAPDCVFGQRGQKVRLRWALSQDLLTIGGSVRGSNSVEISNEAVKRLTLRSMNPRNRFVGPRQSLPAPYLDLKRHDRTEGVDPAPS